MPVKITFELLPVVAILLVLAAWYIPGFKQWYEALKAEYKQLVMVVLLFAVVLVVALLSLAGLLTVYTGPTWKEWVWFPLQDFVAALLINAGVYKSTNYLLGPKS